MNKYYPGEKVILDEECGFDGSDGDYDDVFCESIMVFQYWRTNPDYVVPSEDLELPDYFYQL